MKEMKLVMIFFLLGNTRPEGLTYKLCQIFNPKYIKSFRQQKKWEYSQTYSTRPILTLDPKLDTEYKKIKLHTIQISSTLTIQRTLANQIKQWILKSYIINLSLSLEARLVCY